MPPIKQNDVMRTINLDGSCTQIQFICACKSSNNWWAIHPLTSMTNYSKISPFFIDFIIHPPPYIYASLTSPCCTSFYIPISHQWKRVSYFCEVAHPDNFPSSTCFLVQTLAGLLSWLIFLGVHYMSHL